MHILLIVIIIYFTFHNLKIYIIYLPLNICKRYFSHFYIITALYLRFDKKLMIWSYRHFYTEEKLDLSKLKSHILKIFLLLFEF